MARLGLTDRVRVENLAISDGADRYVWLHAGRNRAGSEWNIIGQDVAGRPTAPEMRVRAVSLDGYFSTNDRIDFVKIDIEGAEDQALRGMRRILSRTETLYSYRVS